MMSLRFGPKGAVAFLAAVLLAAAPARAGFVELQTGFSTEGIGSATARLSSSFDIVTMVGTLTVELANTTSGFGVGIFEAGALVMGNHMQSGLDVSTPGTFDLFAIEGPDAAFLTESRFFTSDGLTDDGFSDVQMVVTFMGTGPGYRDGGFGDDDGDDGGGAWGDDDDGGDGGDDGGDDGGFLGGGGAPPVVPLPAALPMGLAGLVGVVLLRLMKKSVWG